MFPLVSGAWHLNWRAACSPPWCRICSVASALLSGDFGETLGTLSACRAPVEFLFRKPALRCVAGVAPTDHLRLAPAGCRSLAGAPCRLARWWRRGGGELPQHPPCSVVRYVSWWGCRRRKCQHAVGLPHLGWGCLRGGGGFPPCQAVWARQVGRKRHSANLGRDGYIYIQVGRIFCQLGTRWVHLHPRWQNILPTWDEMGYLGPSWQNTKHSANLAIHP